MIDSASVLYQQLKSFSAQVETTICKLHKPCSNNPICANPSKTLVLDFDYIEKEIAKGKRSLLPSCDCVTINKNMVFCFVEIKGWSKFIAFNIADAEHFSVNDKEKIEKQSASYNLKGKLEQSIKDCEEIVSQKGLFPLIPYAYVIVSDINSDNNALGDLASNLTSLAETASIWTYCDEKLKETLNSIDIVVKKVYAHCRDFDQIISMI